MAWVSGKRRVLGSIIVGHRDVAYRRATAFR